MKSRNNSSNKTEKKMAKTENVIKIKLWLTGNGLRTVFRVTKLHIDQKMI